MRKVLLATGHTYQLSGTGSQGSEGCKGAKGACAFQFGCCTLPEVAQRLKSYYRGSERVWTTASVRRSPVSRLSIPLPSTPCLPCQAVCFIALTPATLAKPLLSSPRSAIFCFSHRGQQENFDCIFYFGVAVALDSHLVLV